jgi:hypothetical protein
MLCARVAHGDEPRIIPLDNAPLAAVEPQVVDGLPPLP